jgi:hypothetical protein
VDQLKYEIFTTTQKWKDRLGEIDCKSNLERAQRNGILKQLYQLETIVMPYDPW